MVILVLQRTIVQSKEPTKEFLAFTSVPKGVEIIFKESLCQPFSMSA